MAIQYRFACRRRTAASWTSLNEVLLLGEIGLERDTNKFKFGDGVTAWNSLPYFRAEHIPIVDAAGWFTATNVETALAELAFEIDALTSQSDGGGGGAFAYVGEATVTGSAATSLSISGLNLDADGRYWCEYIMENATASIAQINMYFNADLTATNYDSQVLVANGSASSAGRANSSRLSDMFGVSGDPCVGHFIVFKDMDNKPSVEGVSRYGTTTIRWITSVLMWRTGGTNVTGITLSSSVANSLAVGSKLRVWRILQL